MKELTGREIAIFEEVLKWMGIGDEFSHRFLTKPFYKKEDG